LPLVATRYGDYEIYTVANVGFVPLTSGAILSGNETGMRRALDRLRYGHLEQGLARWMRDLLAQVGAPLAAGQAPVAARPAFAMVGDVAGQGALAAASPQLPFLEGLSMIRVLGNFEAPGMNMVGSLSYADHDKAAAGSQKLDQLQQLAYMASLFATWGLGGRMPDMQVTQQGNDVAFATQLDAAMLNVMLSMIGNALKPVAGQPTFWGG
jgi:hypothetical protein